MLTLKKYTSNCCGRYFLQGFVEPFFAKISLNHIKVYNDRQIEKGAPEDYNCDRYFDQFSWDALSSQHTPQRLGRVRLDIRKKLESLEKVSRNRKAGSLSRGFAEITLTHAQAFLKIPVELRPKKFKRNTTLHSMVLKIGFKHVTSFHNGNSGNIVHVYHYIHDEVKSIKGIAKAFETGTEFHKQHDKLKSLVGK